MHHYNTITITIKSLLNTKQHDEIIVQLDMENQMPTRPTCLETTDNSATNWAKYSCTDTHQGLTLCTILI